MFPMSFLLVAETYGLFRVSGRSFVRIDLSLKTLVGHCIPGLSLSIGVRNLLLLRRMTMANGQDRSNEGGASSLKHTFFDKFKNAMKVFSRLFML